MRELNNAELHDIHGADFAAEKVAIFALAACVFLTPTVLSIISYDLLVGTSASSALTKASIFFFTGIGTAAAFATLTDY